MTDKEDGAAKSQPEQSELREEIAKLRRRVARLERKPERRLIGPTIVPM